MAVIMVVWSGNWIKHYALALQILHEWKTIRKPAAVAAIARERKPRMMLLPYGIPMAIGSIMYFAASGLLI
jgi:prepilin peptidase CpaA